MRASPRRLIRPTYAWVCRRRGCRGGRPRRGGERPSTKDYSALGLKGFNATTGAIQDDGVLELSRTVTSWADSPSAGCITSAGDVALFYQSLLNGGRAHDGTPVWQPAMLAEARRVRTGELRDSLLGHRANPRGFERTNSADAFGHPGLGRPGHGRFVRLSDQQLRLPRHPRRPPARRPVEPGHGLIGDG